MLSRRTFLGALLTSAYPAHALPKLEGFLLTDPGDEMDEALEMLKPYGASFRGGLSNHGPMTAEALVALGRAGDVVGWVASYRSRLEERPSKSTPIDGKEWREALGDKSRSRDWDEWFTKELAESPWKDVMALWVPRLAPGIAAAGLHGVIRVGHAVCSLTVKEAPGRLDELACGLGYWAAEYLALPGEPKGGGKLAPSAALAKVELLPRELRKSRGLITTELKDLRGSQTFEGVIDLVDPAAGSPDFLGDLLGTFGGVFVNTQRSSFEFLHAVTGAAAVVELLPHVKEEDRDAVLAYTWQVTAGVLSRYGRAGLNGKVDPGRAVPTVEALTRAAVATGDEHTIKLTAACQREFQRNPDARLLAAAAKRIG